MSHERYLCAMQPPLLDCNYFSDRYGFVSGLVYPVQSRTRPRRHLLNYLLPVILFSLGFNIPKFLEFQMVNVVVSGFESLLLWPDDYTVAIVDSV